MAQLNVQDVTGPVIWGDVDDDLAIAAGDLVYWDSSTSEFKKADADGFATVATGIAVTGGLGGGSSNQIGVARQCKLYDADAPFTVASPLYLSTTAGGWTHTRVTGALDVVQRVGRSHTTSVAEIDIRLPYEVVSDGAPVLLEATTALLVNDTGPAAGHVLAAASDAITYAVAVPENAITISSAFLTFGCDTTLDASDTITIATACTHTGVANDVITDSLAATALTCTADAVVKMDISSALNATAFLYAGGTIFIDITKAAEGTGGDDPILFGVQVHFQCV